MTQKLRRFVCANCKCSEMTTGGGINYHCAECRKEKGMPDLTSPQYLAHQAVAKARKAGLLADPKTLSCVDCQGPAIEYDHRDYSKPLAVEPVCRRCNLSRGPATQEAAHG